MSRYQVLQVSLFATLLACCSPPVHAADGPQPERSWTNDLSPIATDAWNYKSAAHLLERAGFGGTPAEVESLAAMSPEAAVDYLVDYEGVEQAVLPAFDPSGIYPNGFRLASLDSIVLRALITGKAYGVKATQEGELAYQPAVNEFYTLLISEHAEMRRAGQWWGERMVRTRRPLEEKLTLFWHDHFATSQEKVASYQLMLGQIKTLRRHANGNFRDLLIAVSQDPAMLVWLDNRDNVKGKPNENFAREIMELFCMGEGEGYTEEDIREMARSFTGWSLGPMVRAKDKGRFVDHSRLHDGGVKTFLGRTGDFNGYDAIDIVLEQPATPRFIVAKLYRWLVREELTREVQEELATLLVESKYEMKPLLKKIFLSRDFYSESSVGTHIKSPVEFAVSTYRKLGLNAVPGVPDFMETIGVQGQILFYPPNVAGWPDGRPWINPATLLARGNFVHSLLFGDPATYGNPDKVVAEGYSRIPLMFREYAIEPHLWNPKTEKMEPVSLEVYDKHLAGIGSGNMEGVADGARPKSGPSGSSQLTADDKKEMTSKMSEVAAGEKYNLAVGVYTGFVEAYNRVKPTPRTIADFDLVGMAKAAGVDSWEQAVDYFCRRFLSVPLHDERRAALLEYAQSEFGSGSIDYDAPEVDAALRRLVHLVLSSPEYQLG